MFKTELRSSMLRSARLRGEPTAWMGLVLTVIMFLTPSIASADSNDAKKLLKAMSDYVGAQTSISFRFDAILEVVTEDSQKLQLASSGEVNLQRPDKLRVSRSAGFAEADLYFDGKTMTLLSKHENLYAQIQSPGSVDSLMEELRLKYGMPLPATDLLLSNSYEILMADVKDIMDLGSGVIGGVECDFLAFRTQEVDWQIWIAQGDKPYPCRFVITSRDTDAAPQYSIQVSNWSAGNQLDPGTFNYSNTTDARKAELDALQGDFPSHFEMGEPK